ncbi:MAG: polyprenyl synthetase family protein [Thermodesulfovibrionales bacterium]|nr:polyprenyl synthetase family protein [Thermodesulfovibrionales bacterium]
MDIKKYIKDRAGLVNSFIESYFQGSQKPAVLFDSMRYSLTAGGKRLRPVLCIASYEVFGAKGEEIVPYASALEFIHTYSLIHDDLPAMDDDDLRRGKPTNHKVFGEAIAILAGDGLLTEAFRIFSSKVYRANLSKGVSAEVILSVINEVASSAGLNGMVIGQAMDILSENKQPDEPTLHFIHTNKTAEMIKVSVSIGAMLANAPEVDVRLLSRYGSNIGLAFQIVDDIIDITESTETLGKTKGSDERRKKMTYPSLYGIDLSKEKVKYLIDEAIQCLAHFGEKAEPLRLIARYLLERKA